MKSRLKLPCINFDKPYIDKYDDSSIFVRNEECDHYEISMKRKSNNEKFVKFIFKIYCKGCHNEKKFDDLTEKENNICFNCKNCGFHDIFFSYKDSTQDSKEKNNEVPKEEKRYTNINEGEEKVKKVEVPKEEEKIYTNNIEDNEKLEGKIYEKP